MTPRTPGAVSPRRPISLGEQERRRRRLRLLVLRRRAGLAWARVLSAIGWRRSIVVDGVRYRERTADPLRRALSRGGDGVKEYDVRFPSSAGLKRTTMRIRCTKDRMYADVGPTRRPGLYRALGGRVRPGMRVFELGCSTGAGASMLSGLVGPSGGVVCVDRDRESIRYARLRYRGGPVGFEIGWVESLGGELDGAFDVVIGVDALTGENGGDALVLAELWRVVGPGGCA